MPRAPPIGTAPVAHGRVSKRPLRVESSAEFRRSSHPAAGRMRHRPAHAAREREGHGSPTPGALLPRSGRPLAAVPFRPVIRACRAERWQVVPRAADGSAVQLPRRSAGLHLQSLPAHRRQRPPKSFPRPPCFALAHRRRHNGSGIHAIAGCVGPQIASPICRVPERESIRLWPASVLHKPHRARGAGRVGRSKARHSDVRSARSRVFRGGVGSAS